jgi:hypothetical protein
MKNKLSDLNDHLFAQLDRLADESLTAERLEAEVQRADAIVKLADQITGTAELQLRAAKLFADHGAHVLPMLPQIGAAKSRAIEGDA